MNAREICKRIAELIADDDGSPLDAWPSSATGDATLAQLTINGASDGVFTLIITRATPPSFCVPQGEYES
jgi:hypothetical protein